MKDNHVTVVLKGGLGNQLFQYAMGRSYSLRHGLPLFFDVSWFEEVKDTNDRAITKRNFALDFFELKIDTVSSKRNKSKLSRFLGRFLSGLGKRLPFPRLREVYYERGLNFNSLALEQKPPIKFDGYWQSHKYFSDYDAEIRGDLTRPRKLSGGTLRLLAEINSTDAICMHVRRGDYVTNPKAALTHGTCSVDYYQKGLQVVLPGMHSPRIYIFSDDPEWAKHNLIFDVPSTVVDINGPEHAQEDLLLMSACRRFVIANSSLSWWGAWLADGEGKMVVAPKHWFQVGRLEPVDLLPNDWIRI